MASEVAAPEVESPVAAGAEPAASDESLEPEGKSSIDEMPTEAAAVSSENEEVTEDSTEDSAEPETGEVDDSENSAKITVDDIKTAPIDFRFPTTNQAKHCFTRYNEYHKCEKEKGEGNTDCEKYARWYRSICPGEWIERWNEQRENGTFPGRY